MKTTRIFHLKVFVFFSFLFFGGKILNIYLNMRVLIMDFKCTFNIGVLT